MQHCIFMHIPSKPNLISIYILIRFYIYLECFGNYDDDDDYASSGTGRYVKLCIHLLLKSHTNGRNSATQIGHVSIFGNTAMWFNGHVVQRPGGSKTYGHVVQRPCGSKTYIRPCSSKTCGHVVQRHNELWRPEHRQIFLMDMRAWIGLAQDMGYKLDSRFNSVWDSRFNSVRDSSSYTTDVNHIRISQRVQFSSHICFIYFYEY